MKPLVLAGLMLVLVTGLRLMLTPEGRWHLLVGLLIALSASHTLLLLLILYFPF